MRKKGCLILAVLAVIFLSATAFAMISGLTLNSPGDNAWTNDSTPNFSFTAVSDCNSTDISCILYVNGSEKGSDNAVQNDSETVITSGSLSDGAHSWYVNCTDANETKQSDARTINIDASAPVVALNSPLNHHNSSSESTEFNCSATDLNLSNITLYGNWSGWHANETQTSNPGIFSKTLDEGKYVWSCYACDALNQCAFAPSNKTITIDTHDPDVNLRSPEDEYNTTSKTISFKYNVTDNFGVKNCSLYIDGDLNQTDTSIANGTEQSFSATFSNESYEWTVECYDYAENSDEPSEREFTIGSSSAPSGNASTGSQTPDQSTQNIGKLSTGGRTITNLKSGYKVNFECGGQHSVTIDGIANDSATVVIRSLTITTTLFVDDEKTFDLNQNNKTDFSITLLKISSGKVDLLLKSIPEGTSSFPTAPNMTNETGENETNLTNATEQKEFELEFDKDILFIAISVVAAIAIGVAIGVTIALYRIKKRKSWKEKKTKEWHGHERMDYEYS